MRRREFITLFGGAAATWPLATRAQQQTMPVVGFLSGRSLTTDANLVAAFRQGLAEVGYVDGRDVTIEFHWADGQTDQLPAMAGELAKRPVSVIFGGGLDVKIRAVKDEITTTPVVLATGGDPVRLGIVSSLNRPGGNATAVTVLTSEIWSKRLELLRTLLPSVTVVALLLDPNNPTAGYITKDVQRAATVLGVQVQVAKARNNSEMDAAFAALPEERAGAVLVTADPLFIGKRPQVIELAKRFKIPAVYDRRDFPAGGGLMSYGASIIDQYLQSGQYVGRILKGAQPADLPVMQPTKFEFVINLKTAMALGLTIPPNILALADEVIE